MKLGRKVEPVVVSEPAPAPTAAVQAKPTQIEVLLAERDRLMAAREAVQQQQRAAEAQLRAVRKALEQPATLGAVDAIAADAGRKAALERVLQNANAQLQRVNGDLDTNANRLTVLHARIMALAADITAKQQELAPNGLHAKRVAAAEAALRAAERQQMAALDAQIARKELLATLGDAAAVQAHLPDYSRGRVGRVRFFEGL